MNYLVNAVKTFTQRYYLIMSIMFTISSFFYIAEPHFWQLIFFGVLCNGLDDIKNRT